MMIDLHTHLLPALDDGSHSVEESQKMLSFYDENVQKIALTPHFYPQRDRLEKFLQKREASYKMLTDALEMCGKTFYLGAEVAYFDGIRHCDLLTNFVIGESQLLLCELPMHHWEEKIFSDLLHAAHHYGFVPVLAHIDRYRLNAQAWKWMDSFCAQGGLTQVNTSVFHTGLRKKVKRWILEGKVHFLGSDCHDSRRRIPTLSHTLKKLEADGEASVIAALTEHSNRYFSQ